MNKENTTACNCVKCTSARLKELSPSSRHRVDSEKENWLNKICDEVESECFSDDGEYSRERMKERLLRHITS